MLAPDRGNPAEGFTPDNFTAEAGRLEPESRWWEAFKTEELDKLVEQALSGNLGLSQAKARLDQATALAKQRGSGRWPSLSVEGSVASTEREEPVVEGGPTSSESYELGLSASYELDLWGRVASTAKGATADREATREDLRAAELSVAAETTLRYLDLMNVRAKLDLVESQLETGRKIEELIELRFRSSQASALDVLQQRGSVAAIESILPPLKAREQLILNELTTLVGKPVGTDLAIKSRKLPSLPEVPDPGLPAALLGRRPDVRAAGMRLESADWAISSARADRLPTIRLTASGGYSSDDAGELFDNWISRLVGGLMGPILDGGRRRAEVRRTKALGDERLAAYRAAVLKAVKEVEDALVLDARQEELLEALERQHEATELSYGEAVSRYRKGIESYLSALISLNSKQKVERELSDAAYDQAAYRVRLYRALAGSWKEGSSK
jgi:NodT family efflux transporter outer membrane factor (OMF) lipoprotein